MGIRIRRDPVIIVQGAHHHRLPHLHVLLLAHLDPMDTITVHPLLAHPIIVVRHRLALVLQEGIPMIAMVLIAILPLVIDLIHRLLRHRLITEDIIHPLLQEDTTAVVRTHHLLLHPILMREIAAMEVDTTVESLRWVRFLHYQPLHIFRGPSTQRPLLHQRLVHHGIHLSPIQQMQLSLRMPLHLFSNHANHQQQ
ncbi:hypothetical protein BDF20DRAFT_876701 [Mycotypha africana]|uniref:uncharacterized protein n=1 Tax=Mycotypha africana TaxID=64632 RepID=UPI0023006EC1|nr:uncharacterized protein BDF20DRAFT_876701 [Mycotypha africana]KAI8975053.1 hypothetical protein BDF20DRAFT_876701 [Mycotypha africana]